MYVHVPSLLKVHISVSGTCIWSPGQRISSSMQLPLSLSLSLSFSLLDLGRPELQGRYQCRLCGIDKLWDSVWWLRIDVGYFQTGRSCQCWHGGRPIYMCRLTRVAARLITMHLLISHLFSRNLALPTRRLKPDDPHNRFDDELRHGALTNFVKRVMCVDWRLLFCPQGSYCSSNKSK